MTTYALSAADSQAYLAGSAAAFVVESDVVDHLVWANITDLVLVTLTDGRLAFMVDAGEIID